ncbi:hypothetical protein IT417_01760, partial [bacterium]|nr:hypothetical protein [bacterium]
LAIKKNSDETSLPLSSVTNKDGGWLIEKTAFRDSSGNVLEGMKDGEDTLRIVGQFENLSPSEAKDLTWGVNDSPADAIYGNSDEEAKVRGSLLDKVKFSLSDSFKSRTNNLTLNAFKVNAGVDKPSDCDPNKEVWNSTKKRCDPKSAVTGGTDSNGCDLDSEYWNEEKETCLAKPVTPPIVVPPVGGIDKPSDCDPKEEVWNKNKKVCDPIEDDSGSTPPAVTPPTVNPQNADGPEDCAAIAGSEWNAQQQACIKTDKKDKYDKCTGRFARTCDEEPLGGNSTNCYCSIGGGEYLPLRGVDCRPAACANKRNNDVVCSDGKCESRVKIDAKGNEVLCGSDYTTPGCGFPGDGKCPEATPYYNSATNACQTSAPSSQPEITVGGEPSDLILCVYKINGSSVKARKTKAECDALNGSNGSGTVRCGFGQRPDGKGGCECHPAFVGNANSPGGCQMPGRTDQELKDKRCVDMEGRALSCGSVRYFDEQTGRYETVNCGKNGSVSCNSSNEECIQTFRESAQAVAGVCSPKGIAVGILSNYDGNNKGLVEFGNDCYLKIDSKGQVIDRTVLTTHYNIEYQRKIEQSKDWVQVPMKYCTSGPVKEDYPGDIGSSLNNDGKNNFTLLGEVSAADEIAVTNNTNYMIVFPESGKYNVNIGGSKFENITVNADNDYFFFDDRNGVKGYQSPSDLNNPKPNEDLMLSVLGAKVTLSTTTKNQSLKLSKGMNMISFNYLPSSSEKESLKASEFLDISNSSGLKVSKITYFEGGKWVGGMSAISGDKKVKAGNDFALVPGKGYLIISLKDTTVQVPGFSIKNSVPVALSSGWNLIGINGYQKTFTANSLIDSVNGLSGLKADNVTWWPTSKGRYESFQKSEGVEYGFDFPILKNMGYFVRLSDFEPKDSSAKSVLWNPGSSSHGKAGSTKAN